jgi:hypothetical protein
MIADEPDEDADTLDDDDALDGVLGDGTSKPEGSSPRIELANWPTPTAFQIALNLDAETVAWFKVTYPDWRLRMREVLRAWVTANTTDLQPTQVPSTDAASEHPTRRIQS